MANYLAPIINSQQEDANGNPLSGGTIEVYLAGTSTPTTTYSDKAGLVPNTWPIVLNTLGVNNQGAVWLIGGAAYKYVIKNSLGIVQRTIDNVSGINDTVVTNDQWVVYQGVPTYVSATSFTVVGDQTQIFQVNRRIKTQNTGGIVYSTITASAYVAPNTTVTVQNDSGTLDSGLSQVSYGLISPQNSSLTGVLLNVQTIIGSGTYVKTPGATKARFHGVAPGGAGGGATATAAAQAAVGGGGGAGNPFEFWIVSGLTNLPITFGSAGVGVSGANGGNGGDIVIGTAGAIATIKGGRGGGVGGAIGGFPNIGGAATAPVANTVPGAVVGLVSGIGQAGESGFLFSVSVLRPGIGGSSAFGSGGNGVIFGGMGYGAGGQGAAIGPLTGAIPGTNGAPGFMIIEEYT